MKRSLVFGLAIAGLLVGLMPVAVMAEGGLTLTTPFPAVTVDPGATAKFDITFTTPTPERVDVSRNTGPSRHTRSVQWRLAKYCL